MVVALVLAAGATHSASLATAGGLLWQAPDSAVVSDDRLKQLFQDLENGDAKARLAAIRAIRGNADADDVNALYKLWKKEADRSDFDSSVIYHLEQAIIEIKDPRAIDLLIAQLPNEHRYLATTVSSLAKFEEPRAIDAIFAVYNKGPEALNIKLYLTIGNSIRDHISGPYARDVLIRRLTDGDNLAAEALKRFPEPAVVDALVQALENSDAQMRQLLLESIGVIGNPRASAAVAALLKNSDANLRGRAARTLGKLREAQSAAPLIALLETESEKSVLSVAAQALGEIGNPTALEPLERARDAASDPDLKGRIEVSIALLRKTIAEQRPATKIVSVPADGSTSVSVATNRITITFPDEMQTDSFSVVAVSGSQKPQTAGDDSYYFEDAKTFVMNVRLVADTKYAFSLNSERWKGFRLAGGAPLPPTVIRFSTGTGDSATPQPPAVSGDLMVSALSRGDLPNEFRTINEAILAAKDNTRILIHPGVYRESIVLSRPLTLMAAEAESGDVVIEATDGTCIAMRTTKATLSNLKLRSIAARTGKTGFGIDCPGGILTVEGCEITSDSNGCVIVYNAGANVIARKCRMHDGNEGGVFIYDNAEGTFEECEFTGNRLCNVETKTGGKPVFRNCRIHSGKQGGVYIHDGGAGLFEKCEIRANGLAGVEISLGGAPEFRDCRIQDGTVGGVFTHDKGAGLFQDCDISGNTFAGVEISSESDPSFRRCRIHNGKSGGVYANRKGAGRFVQCEMFENAWVGVGIESESTTTFEDCRIYNNLQSGIYVFKLGEGLFRNCEVFGNNLAGVEIDGGDPMLIECTIHDGKACGVSVMNQGKGQLTQCEMTGNALSGLLVQSGSRPDVRNCKLLNNIQCGAAFFGSAVGSLESCELSGNGHSGVEIASNSDPTFRKCTFHDGKSSGAYVYKEGRGIFEDCAFYANRNVAIYIGEAGNPLIRHCTIRDGLASGVVAEAKALGKLIDCDVFRNVAPQVDARPDSQLEIENCRIRDVDDGNTVPADNPALTELRTVTPRNRIEKVQTQISDKAQLLAAAALKEAGAEVVMDEPESGGHCLIVDASGIREFNDQLLAHVRNLPYLLRLVLSHSAISDAGMENLRDLNSLVMLDLDGTSITDVGLAHLRGLKNMEGLILGDTQITSAGLQNLSGMVKLTGLRLAGTRIDDQGLLHLKNMSDMTILDLDGTPLTDNGLASLRHMAQMSELKLVGTNISGDGLAHLAGMKELSVLDLSFTRVTDAGLAHLRDLSRLSELSLVETGISDSGIMQLSEMTQLEKLNINLTQISAKTVEQLQAKLPDTTIIWTDPVRVSLSTIQRPGSASVRSSGANPRAVLGFDHGLAVAMSSLLRSRSQQNGSSGSMVPPTPPGDLSASGNGDASSAALNNSPSGVSKVGALSPNPGAAGPRQSSVPSRIRRNPVAGFELRIPEDWEVATNSSGVLEISIDAQAGAGLRHQPALWFFHAADGPDVESQQLQKALQALGGADTSIRSNSQTEWEVSARFNLRGLGEVETRWLCRNDDGQNYVIGAAVCSADAKVFASEIETALSTCQLIASPAMRCFVEPSENAYRILLPDGWTWRGQIIRTFEIPGYFEWKAQSEDGLSGCFTSPPGVFNMFQDFLSAEQAAEGIVLEGLRQQIGNVRLTRVYHLPRAEENFSGGLRALGLSPRVEKLRAEYVASVNGTNVVIQTDIVCLMPDASQFPDPHISGRGNWFLFTSGTWAPASDFEQMNSLARGVQASHRTSLRWVIQQRRAVDTALTGRRGVMDEAFAGWDAFIRDMERIPDPDGGPIQEVPNRDGSVWKDPDGVMWRVPPGTIDEQTLQNRGWKWIR